MLLDNEMYFSAPIIDINIHYDQQYVSVFDLGNTLVDLQALVSGITRLCEDDYDLSYEEIIDYKKDEDITRLEKIKTIILDEIPKDNIENIDKLSWRIEEQFAPEKVAQHTVRAYPTISRKFSKKYMDLIRLNSFAQGSLILEIATTVISGLILKFIEKLCENEKQKPLQVTVNNNCIIIDNKNSHKQIVHVKEYRNQAISNEVNGVPIEQYYESVLSSVEINSEDIQASVMSLLHKLSDDKVLSTQVIYNERGIKTLINDIERMRGTMLDISI